MFTFMSRARVTRQARGGAGREFMNDRIPTNRWHAHSRELTTKSVFSRQLFGASSIQKP